MHREAISPSTNSLVPMVSGNTPTFLGAKKVFAGDLSTVDAVIAGLPWEGSNTWGSYSACEQAPKACRNASLRYGTGYVPEYDIDIAQHLRLGDFGDLPVAPTDALKTAASFESEASVLFNSNAVPIFFGGDHSVSYPVVKALSEIRPGRFGVIQFDAHLDNSDDFGADPFARCCPLRRITELPGIDPQKVVQVGIHGPRNSPSQMQFARDNGVNIFTSSDIKRQGLASIIDQASTLAHGVDGYYITICSDVIDHAFNPGGPLDFGGLTAGEMLESLYRLASGPMLGLDIVEVYPRSDVNDASIHLATWLAIYGLAGLAERARSRPQQ